MLRTEEGIVRVESEVDWNDVKSSIVKRLKETFHEHPDWFFTEHDIHSVLYNIAMEELQASGTVSEETRDKHQTVLVHHEYPTPFRCYMKGYGFEKKDEKPYKRGHYDLVILSPEFVRNNKLEVVCGKDYKKFKSAMKTVDVEPLIWACEVIYFPRVKTIPKNAIKIIKQDTLKIKETLGFKVGRNVSFCKNGSVLVFTSHAAKEATGLKQQLARLQEEHEFEICFSTA